MRKSICTDITLATDGKDLFNSILKSLLEDGAPCNPAPECNIRWLENTQSYGYWFMEEKELKKKYSQVHYVCAIHSYVGREDKTGFVEFNMEIEKPGEKMLEPVTWTEEAYNSLIDFVWLLMDECTFKLKELGDGSQGFGYGISVRNRIIYIFKYNEYYGK